MTQIHHRPTTSIASQPPQFGNMGKVASNIRQVASDYSHNLLQDIPKLRNNAMILSMLLLVLERAFIANKTARKAKNTPDAAYRSSEAIKTTIRELGGWTLTYVVFRAFQRATESVMRRMFSIAPQGSLVKDTLRRMHQGVRKGWAGEGLDRYRPNTNQLLTFKNSDRMLKGYSKYLGWTEKIKRLQIFEGSTIPKSVEALEALPLHIAKQMKSRIYNVYTWAPILVGAIPAVLLSGFWLESYTQKHSKQVAATINQKINEHKAPKEGNLALNRRDFKNFVNAIQAKQAQRAPWQQNA